MRVLPFVLLLAGCFDGATTTLSVDIKGGTARVVQQLHNAWPDEVGCNGAESVPASNDVCVAGVRARLERGRETLVEGGATVARAGIVLADGELDMFYDYTAPIGAQTLKDQGLALLWMDERTPGQVEKSKAGKRRAALIAMTGEPNNNRVTVEGRYRRLTGTTGTDTFDVWLLRGKAATITSEWTYVAPTDGPKGPGAWLTARPGLEDALRASGLVITP